MKLKLVSLKTAKLAKEKRFGEWTGDIKTNWNTDAKYFHNKPSGYGLIDYTEDIPYYISGYDNLITKYLEQSVFTYAPEQALLQKWLREKHDIYLLIDININREYHWKYIDKTSGFTYSKGSFETYEKALESGLLAALKIIQYA